MMVSTKGRYALRVMVDLAEHQQEGFVPLKQIARRQEVSEKYLEAVLKVLVRAGFLVGLRGKGGGYRLGKNPEDYTVASVLALTEGSLAPVACLTETHVPCPKAEYCPTLPMWQAFAELTQRFFEGYSIRDLAGESLSGDNYVI